MTARHGDRDLAAIGRLLADPSRCRMLLALDDGRALPSSRLAQVARVAPSTASEHLAQLAAGGLVAVEAHGRHRYYRLAGAPVGRLIEALGALAPAEPITSLNADTRATALRNCRSCYDHIAGRVGVALMRSFLAHGWLADADNHAHPVPDGLTGVGHEKEYRITAGGRDFLEKFGIDLPERRKAVRYCVDWTEQQHHIAGGLGAGILSALTEREWIRRSKDDRAFVIARSGREGLEETFGIAAAG